MADLAASPTAMTFAFTGAFIRNGTYFRPKPGGEVARFQLDGAAAPGVALRSEN